MSALLEYRRALVIEAQAAAGIAAGEGFGAELGVQDAIMEQAILAERLDDDEMRHARIAAGVEDGSEVRITVKLVGAYGYANPERNPA